MIERELFEIRHAVRAADGGWRLVDGLNVRREYRRQRHASSYALVGFRLTPSDVLTLEFEVAWPDSFTPGYQQNIERAVALGVVDGLYGHAFSQFPAAVVLTEFGWDEIGGSELAVYEATVEALSEARTRGEWRLAS